MGDRLNLIQRLFGRRRKASDDAQTAPPSPSSSGSASVSGPPNAIPTSEAKFQIGQIVRHRMFDFRGVVFDVDPVFANTEEWYEAIPEEVRPAKDQPYYHLFAENDRTHYVAYVSEQNLVADESDAPIAHPDIAKVFEVTERGYVLKPVQSN